MSLNLTDEQRDHLRRTNEAMNRRLRQMMGEPISYRYFRGANGAHYCWTTEKLPHAEDYGPFSSLGGVDTDRFADRYVSFVYRPFGKGSRSGKPRQWRLDEESISGASLRKDAKARALRLLRRENSR